MNEFYMIVILPLLRRNTDLGLNGHPITYWLIEICFRLRILIRVKRNLEIVQSVKSYFAKLKKQLNLTNFLVKWTFFTTGYYVLFMISFIFFNMTCIYTNKYKAPRSQEMTNYGYVKQKIFLEFTE